MDVTYTKGLIIKQTVKVKPEPDGTYLLKKNVKYTITMRCVKSADTNFTARQDNWVYAPNGGLWTPTKYSNASLNSSAFGAPLISGQMYVPAKRVISLISDLYGNTFKTELVSASTQEDLRKQIEYIVRNNGMSDDINISDIVSLIGGGLGAILIFITPPTGGTAAVIINISGTGLSIVGAIQVVDKLFNYLDRYGFERASLEGNLNICSTHYISATLGNVWDGWNTQYYINKFSVNGDCGKINTNIYNNQIINWFGWKKP